MVDMSAARHCDKGGIDKWESGASFQFERVGYYAVDYDTTYDAASKSGKVIFNSIVGLREDVAKKEGGGGGGGGGGEGKEAKKGGNADAIREKQAKAKARLAVPLDQFFIKVSDYAGLFTKFDAKGVPTHDKDGEEMKKGALKKLMKDHAKHDKALQSAAKIAAAAAAKGK